MATLKPISDYLTDAVNQQNRLATILTNKGSTASGSEKFNSLIDKVEQIEELKGEERTLENFTNVLSEPESIVQLEYPEPKNLFDIEAFADKIIAKHPTCERVTFDGKRCLKIVNASATVTQNTLSSAHYIKFNYYGTSEDYKLSFIQIPWDTGNTYVSATPVNQWSAFEQSKPNNYFNQLKLYSENTTEQPIYIDLDSFMVADSKIPYEPYPVPKTLNAKLGSKNLFDINTTPQFSYSGATYTVSGTTITFNSNDTANNSFIYSIPVEIGKTYTVSVSSIDWDSTSFGIFLSSRNVVDGQDYGNIKKSKLSTTFTTTSDTLYIHGYLSYGAGNFTFSFDKLQVELGTTATEYTPYISDLTAVKVTRCGKNLFDGNIQVGYELTGTGDNRTVTRGSNTGYKIIRVKPNTTYCFSGDFSASKDNVIRFATFTEYPTENSVSNKFSNTARSRVFTTTDNDNYLFIWILEPQKTTDIAMQIEEGATATEYEQYNGQTYTPTTTGEVTGITNLYPTTTLLTDNAGVVFTRVLQGTQGNEFTEILPSSGKNGIIKINQPIIDSSVDDNIKPENIKKGVKILGILGTYDEGLAMQEALDAQATEIALSGGE